MAGSINVTLHLEGLKATGRLVEDAGQIGLFRAGEYLKGESVRRTPLGDTGKLRGSQDVLGELATSPGGVHDVDVYVPGPYARFQEFGPHFNPETLKHEEGESPYLGAAVAESADQVLQVVADSIREGLGL